MSVGHLLFAGVMTAYILVAIQLEERDLVKQLGTRYAVYREQVPMLVPGLGGRAADKARTAG
jgi:methanethiol S-methyltransferase